MVDKTIIENGNEKNDAQEPMHTQKAVPVRDSHSDDVISDSSRCDKTVVEEGTAKHSTGARRKIDATAPYSVSHPLKSGRKKQSKPRPNMAGKVIDNKFKIIREIDSGGMGVVYEAIHLHLKKRFAIKSILPEYTKTPNFNKRFDREAKTQALLQHPNIIQVTDFIKENDQFYMVMEYVEGQGLNTLIEENTINETDMLSIIKDVLKGLGHAHSKGIIHRDIKPSNIMITPDKTAKIMDFGIALLAGKEKTKSRGVMGTPSYMSPEQINRPEAIDHRTDFYSTGILMYEIVCGKRPFDGKTVRETQKNHIHQKLPEIKSVFPNCATEIKHILRKSLEKRPSERFGDANEFLEIIRAYERQTRIECHHCKALNRVKNKFKLKGEKCKKCGKALSMKSKFTKIWALAFLLASMMSLAYLLYPWPGTLVVRTKPLNAQVFINGNQEGVSPLEMSVSPGSYEIVIQKENMRVVRNIEIKKNEIAALDIDIYKKVELQKIAYDAIKRAYQSASYISRDLNDLTVSKKNLEIAKSIGDSALTESYQQQIAALEQNIEDGLGKYIEGFRDLEAIKPEIRDSAYSDYHASLDNKGGNLDNLGVVWRHFEQYLGSGMQKQKWKTEIIKFADKNSL